MPLQIENTGNGFIGEVGEDWSITYTSSPANLGGDGSRLGSVEFSARCDNTTKFTIDNYLSVKHFYDDSVTRWLSTFDVYLRNVSTDNEFGDFTGMSMLGGLDVDRVSTLNMAGLYQRTITLPAQEPYVISGTTHYTGGSYQTINGESVWVERDITIYDIAAYGDFLYVLAEGGHSGEVVFRMFGDGQFQSVWPVYSDATDIASPQSRCISATSSVVAVGQTGAKRVKLFSTSGTFTAQFGAAGTGNGQFQAVTDIALSTGFNSIFVTDSVVGRVQRFNYSGVYQNQWGTLGTGSGNTVFNAPNTVAIDPKTEHVFVADMNARVRVYDSFGNLQASPMGSYSFNMNLSDGEYVKNRVIGVGFDQRGNAYGFQDGTFYMYARTSNQGWFYGSTRVRTMYADGRPEEAMYARGKAIDPNLAYTSIATVDPVAGQVYYAADRNTVRAFTGTPTTLPALITHYIAMAAPDFPVRMMTLNKPLGEGPYAYIGWDGNVWDHLCELCATTDNAMATFDDQLLIFNRQDRSFALPEDATITPVEFDSLGSGLNIEVTNQNSVWGENADVIYSAEADDNRVFTVDVGGLEYFTIEQNTHAQYVFQPRAEWEITEVGQYTVYGAGDTQVNPTLWRYYGGKLIASVGPEPGTLIVRLYGPDVEPGGVNGPYRIADVYGNGVLTLEGSAVHADPEAIFIGTGMSEAVTNTLVAKRIESPFVMNATIAYTEGSWAAYNAGTPSQKFRISFRNNRGYPWTESATGVGGTFQFVNVVVYHDDSEYIVESVSANALSTTLNVSRYNRGGHSATAYGSPVMRFEEIWNGKIVSEFDSYWSGYTSQDFGIAPLRNKYGFNSRLA